MDFDVTNPVYSNKIRKLEKSDRANADIFNSILLQLLLNCECLSYGKTGITVMLEEIPVNQRKANTFYLRVTDQQAVTTINTIKVSPNMGLKIL